MMDEGNGVLDLGLESFGNPPDSVAENVDEMAEILRQRALRRAGNDAVARRHDTERYLVIVYADRAGREAALGALGLPADERYLAGDAVELRMREGCTAGAATMVVERDAKASEINKSGAAG